MKLNETARRAFEASCSEKMGPLRKEHEKQMNKIHWMTHLPALSSGKEEMIPVNPEAKFNMYVAEVKRFAEELTLSRIDAFIDIHKLINECPDKDDIESFTQELIEMAKGFTKLIKGACDNPLSPYSTSQLKEQIRYTVEQELGMIIGACLPKLDKFVFESALRKERNLPLSDTGTTAINIVSVGKDVHGPIQVGAEHSTQTITGLNQQPFPDEQQSEAFTKISEFLLNKKIWKSGWVNYKEIAETTGLEIWMIKECIEYAVFISHLKIHAKHPDGVLLVSGFGST